MKPIYLLTLLLILPRLAPAQPTADTLDWRRYYPLEVGNVWEYQVAEGEPLLRREIVGDTVAGGRTYFLMEEASYDIDHIGGGTDLRIWSLDTLYVRYNSLGTVVMVEHPDTAAVPRQVPFGGKVSGYFDFRASFGDTLHYGEGAQDFYVTSGGYHQVVTIGGRAVETPAVKTFQSRLWKESYAADIGFLGGGNLWGLRITYANVGGRVYGTSRTPLASEDVIVPEGSGIETVYPNPARDHVMAAYQLRASEKVTVEVFDLLGRRVWAGTEAVKPPGRYVLRIDTDSWATGTYYVRIGSAAGRQAMKPVVVVR